MLQEIENKSYFNKMRTTKKISKYEYGKKKLEPDDKISRFVDEFEFCFD